MGKDSQKGKLIKHTDSEREEMEDINNSSQSNDEREDISLLDALKLQRMSTQPDQKVKGIFGPPQPPKKEYSGQGSLGVGGYQRTLGMEPEIAKVNVSHGAFSEIGDPSYQSQIQIGYNEIEREMTLLEFWHYKYTSFVDIYKYIYIYI